MHGMLLVPLYFICQKIVHLCVSMIMSMHSSMMSHMHVPLLSELCPA